MTMRSRLRTLIFASRVSTDKGLNVCSISKSHVSRAMFMVAMIRHRCSSVSMLSVHFLVWYQRGFLSFPQVQPEWCCSW
jgi:hypothetical protein